MATSMERMTSEDSSSSNSSINHDSDDNDDDTSDQKKDWDAAMPAARSNDNDDAAVDSLISDSEQKLYLDEANDGDNATNRDLLQPTSRSFSATLRRLAHWIQHKQIRRILVVSGAGVSVAAGIPDFRSPGTGLYDNLQSYNLPYPEAVFDISYYSTVSSQPFCRLASELWPGLRYQPTLTHSFLVLLARKNLLLRNYSQNIDGLEYMAGLDPQYLVECHGHFRTASCVVCGQPADINTVKQLMVQHQQAPVCVSCGSVVKPDIVFFGQGLPRVFFQNLKSDLREADLCLILGTSLSVAPVSIIPDQVSIHCKRVMFNRELVGNLDIESDDEDDDDFNIDNNDRRDYFCQGDVDDSVWQLAELLGWQDELKQLHDAVNTTNNSSSIITSTTSSSTPVV